MKTSHVSYPSGKGSRSKVFPEINRAEVARQLDITRSHVSKILSGHVEPSSDILLRLAAVLGIRAEELMNRIHQVNALHVSER
jgi:transcriptional regulator with XRE-family HTH domain